MEKTVKYFLICLIGFLFFSCSMNLNTKKSTIKVRFPTLNTSREIENDDSETTEKESTDTDTNTPNICKLTVFNNSNKYEVEGKEGEEVTVSVDTGIYTVSCDMFDSNNVLIYSGEQNDVVVKGGQNTDVTLKLQKALTVTFNLDSEIYKTIKLKKGSFIEKPEDPVIENGYFFSWLYDNEYFDFSKPVTEDMEISAQCVIRKGDFLVIYMVDDHLYYSEDFYIGDTVYPLGIDSSFKKGYSFEGWYTKDNVEYDFMNTVEETGDLFLYAHFIPAESVKVDVLLTIDDNEEKTYDSLPVTYGTTVKELIIENIFNENIEDSDIRIFEVYYKTKDDDDFRKYYDFETITNDCTIKASISVQKSFKVHYIIEEKEYVTYSFYPDEKPIEPTIYTYPKIGYRLTGWYTEQGEKFDFENTKITREITLTAKFEEAADITITSIFKFGEEEKIETVTIRCGETANEALTKALDALGIDIDSVSIYGLMCKFPEGDFSYIYETKYLLEDCEIKAIIENKIISVGLFVTYEEDKFNWSDSVPYKSTIEDLVNQKIKEYTPLILPESGVKAINITKDEKEASLDTIITDNCSIYLTFEKITESEEPEPEEPIEPIEPEEPIEPIEPKKYTVSYYVNGSFYDSEVVEEGSYATNKEVALDSIPEGYEFVSWCIIDSETGNPIPYDFENTQITSDLDLFAGLKVRTVVILTLNYEDQSITNDIPVVKAGITVEELITSCDIGIDWNQIDISNIKINEIEGKLEDVITTSCSISATISLKQSTPEPQPEPEPEVPDEEQTIEGDYNWQITIPLGVEEIKGSYPTKETAEDAVKYKSVPTALQKYAFPVEFYFTNNIQFETTYNSSSNETCVDGIRKIRGKIEDYKANYYYRLKDFQETNNGAVAYFEVVLEVKLKLSSIHLAEIRNICVITPYDVKGEPSDMINPYGFSYVYLTSDDYKIIKK